MTVIQPPSEVQPDNSDTIASVPVLAGYSDGYGYIGVVPEYGAERFQRIDVDDYTGQWGKADPGVPTDYDIGGADGDTNNQPLAYGAVVPDADSFNMRGQTLYIRRPREHSAGPVGSSDYASQLQLAIAQSVVNEAYFQASQSMIAEAI